MKIKAVLISAFPACGKTHFYRENSIYYNKNNAKAVRILDSDSSDFSWVKDKNGNNTNIRNQNFVEDYGKHILDNIYKQDIIFISSHKEIREWLKNNNVNYTIIYPNKKQKDNWIKRFIQRGNDEKFISFMSENFEKFIDEIEMDNFPKKIKLNNEFIKWEHLEEYITRLSIWDRLKYEE